MKKRILLCLTSIAGVFIAAVSISCAFPSQEITEGVKVDAALTLDLQNLSRRAYLAVMKAKPTHTVSVEQLQQMAGQFVETEARARNAVPTQKVGGANALQTLSGKRFTETGGARSVAGVPLEEPVAFYTFELENTENGTTGFVLTCNDERLGNILAVVDEGSLDNTENTFIPVFMSLLENYVDTSIEEYNSITPDEIETVVNNLEAETGGARSLTTHWQRIRDGYTEINKSAVSTDFQKQVSPLIKTKWGQREPYNFYVKEYQSKYNDCGSGNYVTGCIPVALAQMAAYWSNAVYSYSIKTTGNKAKPFSITGKDKEGREYYGIWGGRGYSKYDIVRLDITKAVVARPSSTSMFITGPLYMTYYPLPDLYHNNLLGEVQALMHEIGLSLRAKYEFKNTAATVGQAYFWLDSQNFKLLDYSRASEEEKAYSSSTIYTYNNWDNKIRSYLNQGIPLFVTGDSLIGSKKKGHAWLIDGYGRMSYYEEYMYKKGTKDLWIGFINVRERLMVHCNMGWAGDSDGWYIWGIFDADHLPHLDGVNVLDKNEGYDFSKNVEIIAAKPK